MAASICEIRGGSLISVPPPPPQAELDRGNTVKWEEKRGLLHSSREPVLMAQSFYEGLRISVGVFLGVWLVGREQNLADITIWFELGLVCGARLTHTNVLSLHCFGVCLFAFYFASCTPKWVSTDLNGITSFSYLTRMPVLSYKRDRRHAHCHYSQSLQRLQGGTVSLTLNIICILLNIKGANILRQHLYAWAIHIKKQ